MKKLTVACYRPKNLRDVLIPSKLRPCQEIECNVEHHLKNTHLATCVENLNYDEMREDAIAKELPSLNHQVQRINNLVPNGHKKLVYNPYRKKHTQRSC